MPYMMRTTVGYKCLICSCYRVFSLALSICSIQGLLSCSSPIFTLATYSSMPTGTSRALSTSTSSARCLPTCCVCLPGYASTTWMTFHAIGTSLLPPTTRSFGYSLLRRRNSHITALFSPTQCARLGIQAHIRSTTVLFLSTLWQLWSLIISSPSSALRAHSTRRRRSFGACRISGAGIPSNLSNAKMKEKVQYDLDLQNHFDTAKLTG